MITPGFLDELDQFRTSLKQRVHDRFQGEQQSRELGEGLTFADHRQYAPGDDTRLIDWKLFGRTDELFIKQFEQERDFTLHVLLDASASMDFGTGERNKFEYAAKLGLGFAYLTAQGNNDFRFVTFAEDVERIDADRSNRGEVLALVDRLNAVEPSGHADFDRALSRCAAAIQTHSVVFVASDLLGDPVEIGEGLQSLARNDLTVAQVLAPEELALPVQGDTRFEDVESDDELRTYVGSRLEREYRHRLDDHVAAVASECQRAGARHQLVDSGEDFFDTFADVWFGGATPGPRRRLVQ
jgi:uncharacterized protein (DUF58 family)